MTSSWGTQVNISDIKNWFHTIIKLIYVEHFFRVGGNSFLLNLWAHCGPPRRKFYLWLQLLVGSTHFHPDKHAHVLSLWISESTWTVWPSVLEMCEHFSFMRAQILWERIWRSLCLYSTAANSSLSGLGAETGPGWTAEQDLVTWCAHTLHLLLLACLVASPWMLSSILLWFINFVPGPAIIP